MSPGGGGGVHLSTEEKCYVPIGENARSDGNSIVLRFEHEARCRLRVGHGRHPAFCTLRGHLITDAYVRVMMKRLAARAGIEKRVHAHGLRHTHAAQLRAEGVDIAIISRQLGHTRITTTARYLDHLAPRAVIEAMRSRSWTGA